MEQKPTNTPVWKKLFTIQKSIKTFNSTDDAAKTDAKGQSEYKFTPGWKIVETLRELMDQCGLMLIPQFRTRTEQMIEYPVFLPSGGRLIPYTKKEMYVSVEAEFTFIDTEGGETAGPFCLPASGANGTDKSMATALAYAERNFLLKFFHITTHEKDEEPDQHDSATIPGVEARCLRSGCRPDRQQGGADIFNMSDPTLQDAVQRLSLYQWGTEQHRQMYTQIYNYLQQVGYPVQDENFLTRLTETAQARKEGREPNF